MRRTSGKQIITAFGWAIVATALSGTMFEASSSRGMAANHSAFNGSAPESTGIQGAGHGFGFPAHNGGIASGRANPVARFGYSNMFYANGRHDRQIVVAEDDGAFYPGNGPSFMDDGGMDGMPPPYPEPVGPPPCGNPYAPAAMFLNCGSPYGAPAIWPVRPPLGAVTPILPDGAAYEYVNGVSYYIRGGAYYRPRVTRNGILFEVVRKPT
jgi:hypothetical protein